jgi:hypothetical protein
MLFDHLEIYINEDIDEIKLYELMLNGIIQLQFE